MRLSMKRHLSELDPPWCLGVLPDSSLPPIYHSSRNPLRNANVDPS
jgi:hypothetical protein